MKNLLSNILKAGIIRSDKPLFKKVLSSVLAIMVAFTPITPALVLMADEIQPEETIEETTESTEESIQETSVVPAVETAVVNKCSENDKDETTTVIIEENDLITSDSTETIYTTAPPIEQETESTVAESATSEETDCTEAENTETIVEEKTNNIVLAKSADEYYKLISSLPDGYQRVIVSLVHQNGGIAVIDCAQSVAHMRVDVRDLDADFAAFSGHKIYGPMGIGVLYGKYGILDKMPPFLSGGDMISHVHESGTTYAKPPRKFEAGTCNLGAEAGLVEAIRYVESIGLDKIREHETELCRKALKGLNNIGGIDIYLAVSDRDRSLISFNIRGVHPHDAATIMDSFGVCVRAGHHCAEPLMERLGIGSCLRASFALYNDEEDVDIFLSSVEQTRKVMGIGS